MAQAQAFTPTLVETTFAGGLRYWRHRRGLSQLALSADSGISQRHLSFLESGRSQPSREMVLKLSHALQLPPRERNLLLLAAGFAPLYRERALGHPDLAAVQRAMQFMLVRQEPYPAVVVDRLWNLTQANAPAQRMLGWLLGPPPASPQGASATANLIEKMLLPDGLRPFIANWHDIAAEMLRWVHREVRIEGPDGDAQRLLDRLLAIEGVPADWRLADPEACALPFLPLSIVKDGLELNFFTTITTLGTPHDVSLHGLRLECFFAADEATAAWVEGR